MKLRKEKDTLGSVQIPSDRYWGVHTERAFQCLNVGLERMPVELVYAFAYLKKASAVVNWEYKKISGRKKDAILKVADEILQSRLDDHFPLKVWQSGSGKETHMNINEVLSSRAKKKLGKTSIHPFDEVSLNQNSNTHFSCAMHIAASTVIMHDLLPKLSLLHMALQSKMHEFAGLMKVGRAHMMDSNKLPLSEEFASYASQIEKGMIALHKACYQLYELPLGTEHLKGSKIPKRYSHKVAKLLHKYTDIPYKVADHSLALIASHDLFVQISSIIKQIALAMHKISSDLTMMASGPQFGLNEISLPTKGISGKSDTSILEMVSQISAQVLGNDATISFANSQGHFELNTYKPVIIYNLLQSCRLIADGAVTFANECIIGIEPNFYQFGMQKEHPAVLSSALNQVLGSTKTAQIFQRAQEKNLSIMDACVQLGFLNKSQFKRLGS